MTIQPKFDVDAGEEQPAKLSRAILFYTAGESVFATVHGIGLRDTQPMILEGKALTAGIAMRLARDLCKSVSRGGFVPSSVLYMDGDSLAWWLPSANRHIAFRAPQLGAAERGEVTPHPSLVFAVDGQRNWRVWAVLGTERPDEGTQLYRAPYFNVWDDGRICTGNVTLPEGTTAERIEAWNKAFFGSFFTHPNGTTALLKYRGGPFAFWQSMLDGKHERFPERVLVPTEQTLGEALRAGRGRRTR